MIGIVASRLVERFARPVVLVARSGDRWKGSGRSIGSFDLHAGLAACADHLERFGGHRAAAGLSIRHEQLEPFAAAFAAHADAVLDEEELEPVTRIDAVVPATALTLGLARELERLAPFGLGNPELTLLAAAVEPVDAATVGEGKHLRFRVRQHGRDGGQRDRLRPRGQPRAAAGGTRFDVAFRLKQNRWNGTVAPQLVVRRVFDAAERATRSSGRGSRELWRAGEAAWSPEAQRRLRRARARRRGRGQRQLLESPTFRALLAGRGDSAAARGVDARRAAGMPRSAARRRRSSSASSRSTRRRSRYAAEQLPCSGVFGARPHRPVPRTGEGPPSRPVD